MVVAAGIHFGNTNSVISVCKDGRVETVANETGDRVTSTAVAYTGEEKVVGQPAKQFMVRNPLSCISNIKACIGKSITEEEFPICKKESSCHMKNEKGVLSFHVKVNENYVKVSPVKAASFVFTKLLEIAELVGGKELEDVVLTVPYNFSEQQRVALCEAAENIGCNVLRIISEPAAALLAYDIGQSDPKEHCKVLVYRLGGSSMDASIVDVVGGMYHMVNYKSNPHFGSKHFDEQFVKHLCTEFLRKHKEDISENKRSVAKLNAAAESCKHGLSKLQATTCAVDSLYDGIDFHYQLPRAKFESLCGSLFTKCMKLLEEVLSEVNCKESMIDKVILVGGGTRMPRLIQLVKNKFSHSQILNSIEPEELLSRGAALQAALLQGHEDTIDTDVFNLNCVNKNIGIKTLNENGEEQLDILLHQGLPVPAKRSKSFKIDNSQSSACVSLYESSDKSFQNATLLAKLVLRDLKEPEELTLNMEIKRNASLVAILSESASDRTESVTLAAHKT